MRVPACSASSSLEATCGSMATRRCSYTAAFKLKLVEYAERHGNRCAGREFDVCEKLIRNWRKKKAELQSLPGSRLDI